MVAAEDEPHRPTMPPYPGWSGLGDRVSEEAAANKLFAHNNAKLRADDLSPAVEQQAAADATAAGPGRYQALNSEHDAHAAEVAARAEEIKQDHGVRLAGELQQRGVTDGVMVSGTIDAFATTAANNGMQSVDVKAMAAEDHDKALTAAVAQAEQERQAAAGPSAEAAAEKPAAERETPSAGANGAAPEVAAGPEAGSDPRQERLQRLAPEAGAEASDVNAFREAGYEMTDSRAARLARLNDQGGSGPETSPPSNDGPKPSPPSPGLGE